MCKLYSEPQVRVIDGIRLTWYFSPSWPLDLSLAGMSADGLRHTYEQVPLDEITNADGSLVESVRTAAEQRAIATLSNRTK